MRKNIKILFNSILLIFWFIVYFHFVDEYNPTKMQLSAFIFSIVLLITRTNYTSFSNISILKKFTINGEYVIYFSIFIQIILILYNFDLDNNLTEKISVASALCLITYSLFNP